MMDDVVSKLNLNHINCDVLVTNNNNNSPLMGPLQLSVVILLLLAFKFYCKFCK